MPRYDFKSQRLYIPYPLFEGALVAPSDQQTHYLLHVLRMEELEELLVFNGENGEWLAKIKKPTKRIVALSIIKKIREQEKSGNIHLAFAPLKSARMDYGIQKAVEMGVSKITPIITQFTQVSNIKHEKIMANAIEAAEQCGILSLPKIEMEKKLSPFLDAMNGEELLIFCDEYAENTSPLLILDDANHLNNPTKITVLIGPEGGFSQEERIKIMQYKNCCRISLGPRILRADTAMVAALTLVQATLGDWS